MGTGTARLPAWEMFEVAGAVPFPVMVHLSPIGVLLPAVRVLVSVLVLVLVSVLVSVLVPVVNPVLAAAMAPSPEAETRPAVVAVVEVVPIPSVPETGTVLATDKQTRIVRSSTLMQSEQGSRDYCHDDSMGAGHESGCGYGAGNGSGCGYDFASTFFGDGSGNGGGSGIGCGDGSAYGCGTVGGSGNAAYCGGSDSRTPGSGRWDSTGFG